MTTIATSASAQATAFGNQRKIDHCQNGVLWAGLNPASGQNFTPTFEYSADGGQTWTAAATAFPASDARSENGFSFFIDLDDFIHVVYVRLQRGHYVRGTPNAGRTDWTWSSPLEFSGTEFYWPDVVAFRTPGSSPTTWDVCIVGTYQADTQPQYERLRVANNGTVTSNNHDGLSVGKVPHTGALGASNNAPAVHGPTIDFNHTGDGKTVAGGTPHLYAAWSAPEQGHGTRFKKATYSGGTWSWGTERVIDADWYVDADSRWLNCLFDGTRVIIAGFLRDHAGSHHDLVLYERDAADTTTTKRTLLDNVTADVTLNHGSATYDGDGNVYLFGRNVDEAAGTFDLVYRKWERATTTLGPEVVIDAGVGSTPFLSAQRGYSGSATHFVYTDGTASPYDVKHGAVALNAPPNASTGLSPDGGVVLDKDITQRFSWPFSDPDPGDSQSAYELRYRTAGSATWTTVSGGATQYHDFAGGTFAADDWEWQVRTTDNGGETGPWSATATFTAASTPAAPSITAPINNGTISTESYVVEWTAAAQEAYEVRRVADAAGSPDTGTVYSTTGTVVSTGKSRSVTFETNGRTEHVQVRVRDGGLWSTWASVKVNVSYTVPATPTLVALADDTTASIAVAITNPAPTGSEPTVISNDLYVRLAAGQTAIDAGGRPVGDATGIRIAASLPNGGAFTDRAVAAGVEYEYRVVAQGDNDTTATSAWTPVS